MKTLLALATGAVLLPAFAAGAYARTTPAVYLVTSIRALSPAPGEVRYAVTVRPVGGAARGATLVLGTTRPATWTAAAPGCLSSGDRTALACDLGDVGESEARTLRLTGRPGASSPAGVPVVAQAAATNAPAVTSSLGPGSAGRSPADDEPPPAPEAVPASPDPAESAPAAAESPEPQAVPDASPPAESPSAEPSEAAAPLSHRARPLGGPPKAARPAPVPRHAAPASPAAPSPSAAHALPPAPIIPHVPIVPDVPPAEAAPPLPIVPGGPAAPLPAASAPAALPQIATHPSPSEGISELNTLSPAGAMQAGRTSWTTLIAVAVVTEAGLLWLVAGFTVWRRKRVRMPGRPAHARPRRLLLSRLLP